MMKLKQVYGKEAWSHERERVADLSKTSLILFAKDTALQPCKYYHKFKVPQTRLFIQKTSSIFKQSSGKKSMVLEIVYSNMPVAFEVEYLGGYRYFFTFIDEASRKVLIELLKSKVQVFEYY